MDTLRGKYTKLEDEVVEKITELLEKKGVNSASQSDTSVLKVINEEMMWNLEGGRYLVELSETSLIDNRGYTYALDILNLERVCEVVDSIAESCYDFRVGTMNINKEKVFRYFDNKEDAYEFFIEYRAIIIDEKQEGGEVWTEERREDGDYESGDYYSIDEDEGE